MKLADFDYALPKELIAQYPLKERDSARLLVVDRQNKKIEHRAFRDIIGYLRAKDLLVLNDTRVLPSRIFGRRATGGEVELLLLRQKHGLTFDCLVKPGRLKLKEKITFNGAGIYAELTHHKEVTFTARGVRDIYAMGVMPLPPYIKRRPEALDNVYYQTVYSKKEGAVAAPTAGLHFTESLLRQVRSSGVYIASITLHTGVGTFAPVKTEDITKHRMEPEYFAIGKDASRLIRKVGSAGGRICAVGTTSLRVLETWASSGMDKGQTDLFIYPGYTFKIVDCLLTNFHLPRTTLFMLVCAFAGERLIKQAYQEAIDRKYRFYSYGDAMLIV